jgi:phosphoribosylaminoimidazole-succinocarboxamide synthase
MSYDMDSFIFAGVDGSGKSTMAETMHGGDHKDRHHEIDSLTELCDYSKWPTHIEDKESTIILTADLDVLKERIKNRGRMIDMFETERALYYYDCRFREIASYYGIPIIDTTKKTPEQIIWEIRRYNQPLSIPLKDMTAEYCDKHFELIKEGESKKVYADPYSDDHCYIVLKDTIYSHSKQSTSEIEGLGAIRAENCRYFLNALRKNSVRHSYVAINDNGVIYSKRMHNINPLEVVVKEYVEGTDKHSYYRYKENYADEQGKYLCGPYVRFDWRNPNHLDENGVDVRESLEDYYKVEEEMGKKAFFEKYLKRPMGDKTVNTHIIDKIVVNSVADIEIEAIKTFNTIKYYLAVAGLVIKDVCFMFSEESDGHIYCWSEINQDCMRVMEMESNDNTYDKDIWRAGGSSAVEKLVAKWTAFNSMFRAVNKEFEFDPQDQHTFDYVKVIERCYLSDPNTVFAHTDHYMKLARGGSRRFVVEDDTLFADCLFTDFQNYNSRAMRDNYPHVIVKSVEEGVCAITNSARRVLFKSFDYFMDNKDHDLFKSHPERVIVQVSSMDEVVTVSQLGNDVAISLDFYEVDGDVQLINNNFPDVKKFMNVYTLDQTIYAWSNGYVPIVPKTIKNSVASMSIGTEFVDVIYQHIDGSIVDKDRVRFNDVFFNDPNIQKYIFDKKKGDTLLCIGDFGQIVNTTKSIFSNQSVIKSNILSLYESTPVAPYAEVRLTNSVWDTHFNPETLVTDFLSLLKYRNVNLGHVLNNLNADRWNVFKEYNLETIEKTSEKEGFVSIAITGSKYDSKTESYLLDVFGIKLLPHSSPRSLYRDYEVVDVEKFEGNGGEKVKDRTIKFIMCKPKDMPYLLSSGYVKGAVTYDSVMCRVTDDNQFICVKPQQDDSLSLCLIKRKGEEIKFPVKVAAEHPYQVRQWLHDSDIDEIVTVNGSSESYLVNKELGFSLADAVVESGKTLDENNLEVYATIKRPLKIGLYIKN